MARQHPNQQQPVSAEDNNAKMAMKALRTEVSRVLCQWDPLAFRGLSGFETAYGDFVGPLVVLLRKGAKPMDIAAHLDRVVQSEWKLPPCREKCLEIAEKIHRAGAMFHLSQ